MSQEKNLLESFLDNSIINATIGAIGMSCRLLLSKSRDMNIWKAVRHILAAMGTGVLAGHSVGAFIDNESAKFAAVSVAGCAAPEVFDAVIEYTKGQIEKFKKKS
jgi:hypothetical protein